MRDAIIDAGFSLVSAVLAIGSGAYGQTTQAQIGGIMSILFAAICVVGIVLPSDHEAQP